jgi:hypothetical protein
MAITKLVPIVGAAGACRRWVSRAPAGTGATASRQRRHVHPGRPRGRSPARCRPRNPRSSRLGTSTSSSTPASPASFMSSCSWQLPGQPPSSHNRSPQIVLTARPWAVWAWRLASYTTFWLAHPRGRCTRVANPSTTTASPAAAISTSSPRRSSRVVMKVPSGWQKPRAPSGPSSRSRLSPTSVLEIPTMRPARRYDSPSSSTAATASRRTSSDSGGVPPVPGGMAPGGQRERPARPAPLRAATNAGNMTTGPDLLAGFRHLADGLVPSTSGRTEHHRRDQIDLDTLSAELLAVVDQTMEPTRVSLWLRPSPHGSSGTARSHAGPTPWAY